jgi:hypothetical protein
MKGAGILSYAVAERIIAPERGAALACVSTVEFMRELGQVFCREIQGNSGDTIRIPENAVMSPIFSLPDCINTLTL